MKRILPIITCFLILLNACQSPKETAPQLEDESETEKPFKLDFEKIAKKIIERADLQTGERVLMVAKPGNFDSLIIFLAQEIKKQNAEYLGTFSVNEDKPELWETDFTRVAQLDSVQQLARQFQSVDLGIMLPGAEVTHVPYAAMQEVLRTAKGRTIHFHWAGSYMLNGSLYPRSKEVDELYQSALLETDYEKLRQLQIKFENAARNNSIRVTTHSGTDIQFSIDNRPVTKQDGNASKARSEIARNLIDREVELPAGAVRVAPIEETVEGKIVFQDTEWKGVTVKDLMLEFKAGKIINMKAKEGLNIVKKELAEAGASAAFCELAVGLNPLLSMPDLGPQWIPYYGYGAGIIRLSLGDNTELGGTVGGGYVRWNFFVNATLKIGDQVWVQDGKLIIY